MGLVKTVEIVSKAQLSPGYSFINGTLKGPPQEMPYSGKVPPPGNPRDAVSPVLGHALTRVTTYRDTASGWSHTVREPHEASPETEGAVRAAQTLGRGLVGRRNHPITPQELDDALHPENAVHRAALEQAKAQVEKDKENT